MEGGKKVGLTLNSTEASDSYQKQNMGVPPDCILSDVSVLALLLGFNLKPSVPVAQLSATRTVLRTGSKCS